MAEADHSGSLKLLIAFVGGGAFIVACVIALQGMYLHFEWNNDVQRSAAQPVELQKMRAEQNGDLGKYRLVPGEVKDPKVAPTPSIGIPILKAMEAVIAEHAANAPKAVETGAKAPLKDDVKAKDPMEKKPDAKH